MKKVGNTYPKNTQGATYKTVSLRLEIIYSIPIPPESDYSHSIFIIY